MIVSYDYPGNRKPKPELGTVQSIKRFFWDPEKRTVLDNNAREWGQFGIFYLCFYGVLFTFSFIQLWLTYKYVLGKNQPVMKFEKPTVTALITPDVKAMFRMSSMNLPGPGIAMRPNVIPNQKIPSIVLDKRKEVGKPEKYIRAIAGTLADYRNYPGYFDMNCSDRVIREETPRACFFNVKKLKQCSKPPYGYSANDPQPCVYILFNKRINWLPIFYSQASKLPAGMPDWLKIHIQDSDKFHVWLSCEGVTKRDQNHTGVIEYLPQPGFPVQYFPYAGQKHYHAPVVALRFPNVTRNEVIKVACRAWARNIDSIRRWNLEFKLFVH